VPARCTGRATSARGSPGRVVRRAAEAATVRDQQTTRSSCEGATASERGDEFRGVFAGAMQPAELQAPAASSLAVRSSAGNENGLLHNMETPPREKSREAEPYRPRPCSEADGPVRALKRRESSRFRRLSSARQPHQLIQCGCVARVAHNQHSRAIAAQLHTERTVRWPHTQPTKAAACCRRCGRSWTSVTACARTLVRHDSNVVRRCHHLVLRHDDQSKWFLLASTGCVAP